MVPFKKSFPVICLIFGVATFGLNLWAHEHANWVENWYSRGFYLLVRQLFDATTGRLPIPAFYLFWAGVLVFWGVIFRRRPRERARAWRYWLLQLTGFGALMFGLFFWLWGFNYARIPFERQIGLAPQPLDSAALWSALYRETGELTRLRERLRPNDSLPIAGRDFWPLHAEDTVRAAVEKYLGDQGFPTTGNVRGRLIYPEGTLYAFGAAGIYWPFSGEGNLEAGLHPLQILPSMAHEMSHGYGCTDEGMCNFIAYVALCNHSNPYLAYGARLDYWTTLAETCRANAPARYDTLFKPAIQPGIVADLLDISRQARKFKELAPELRYQVYDSYLKAQGIASGMLNYDEVVVWVEAWKRREKSEQ